jgi:2-methylcitrate dehydratase PrpD
MGVSEQAARWLAGLRWEQVPPEVVEAVKLQILDLAGVMLASRADPLVRKLRAALPAQDGGAPALGLASRTSLADAALLNGVMAAVLEFDDTHVASSIHATSASLSAALPVCHAAGSPGRQLILAVLAGNELSSRLGLVSSARLYNLGIHPSGVFGVFGAAYALAAARALPAPVTVNAIGICGSQSAALMASWEDGTEAKSLHMGLAAGHAVQAVALAEQGVTGPEGVFDGRYNWYRAHVQDPAAAFHPEALTEALGERWETLNIASKAYPSAFPIHPYIDAALHLQKAHRLAVEAIEEIACHVAPARVATLCEPRAEKLRPLSAWHARVSLQHSVAEALVTGRSDKTAYAPGLLADPAVNALAARVAYVIDEQEAADKSRSGGRVDMRLRDGRTLTHTIEHMRGTRRNPLRREDFIAKFRSNAGDVLAPGLLDETITGLLELDKAANVAPLFGRLEN